MRRIWAPGRAVAILLCAGAGLAATACGDGRASEQDGPTASLQVTRDFGRETVISVPSTPLPHPPTVLRLLRDHGDVKTSWGGRIIDSIDGLQRHEVSPEAGHGTLWVLNVNGIEADVSPARYRVHPGDVVQWDLRDWFITLDVRATVGAFPETFTRGIFGRRFPVELKCAQPTARACLEVRRRFDEAGIETGRLHRSDRLPARGLPRRATVLVGSWDNWRTEAWPGAIDSGPDDSGVFARFTKRGDRLLLLDWNGDKHRAAPPGTGLIAAMRPTEEDLLWVITGANEAGVDRAAAALASPSLDGAFAVAVTPSGVEKLPLPPR